MDGGLNNLLPYQEEEDSPNGGRERRIHQEQNINFMM